MLLVVKLCLSRPLRVERPLHEFFPRQLGKVHCSNPKEHQLLFRSRVEGGFFKAKQGWATKAVSCVSRVPVGPVREAKFLPCTASLCSGVQLSPCSPQGGCFSAWLFLTGTC